MEKQMIVQSAVYAANLVINSLSAPDMESLIKWGEALNRFVLFEESQRVNAQELETLYETLTTQIVNNKTTDSVALLNKVISIIQKATADLKLDKGIEWELPFNPSVFPQ